MDEVWVRIAPSPSGNLHIGTARTALFNYLFAKKNNGKYVLRIEDTDQEREVEGEIDFIYNTLDLCGFKIDEGPNNEKGYGPYIQSERKDIYHAYIKKLIDINKSWLPSLIKIEIISFLLIYKCNNYYIYISINM